MKTKYFLLIALVVSVIIVSCNKREPNAKVELKNDIDSISYFSGVFAGWTLKELDFTNINPDVYCKAVNLVLKKKEYKLGLGDADYNIGWFFDRFRKRQSIKNFNEGKKFLAKNKNKKGVITTASGLQYEIIKEGTGIRPKINDKVIIKYKGELINGKVFIDYSEKSHVDTFILNPKNHILTGWVEALQLMKTGSRYRLYIPNDLAFGEMSVLSVKPGMTVIFDLQLLAIIPSRN